MRPEGEPQSVTLRAPFGCLAIYYVHYCLKGPKGTSEAAQRPFGFRPYGGTKTRPEGAFSPLGIYCGIASFSLPLWGKRNCFQPFGHILSEGPAIYYRYICPKGSVQAHLCLKAALWAYIAAYGAPEGNRLPTMRNICPKGCFRPYGGTVMCVSIYYVPLAGAERPKGGPKGPKGHERRGFLVTPKQRDSEGPLGIYCALAVSLFFVSLPLWTARALWAYIAIYARRASPKGFQRKKPTMRFSVPRCQRGSVCFQTEMSLGVFSPSPKGFQRKKPTMRLPRCGTALLCLPEGAKAKGL